MRSYIATGIVILSLAACAPHASPSAEQSAVATATPDSGAFAIDGDPRRPGGAAWSFRGTERGVRYDLTGVLLAPAGDGPFPAVILSHGSGGSARFIASEIGPTMTAWGFVCIAVDSPMPRECRSAHRVDARTGASRANVFRAHMTASCSDAFRTSTTPTSTRMGIASAPICKWPGSPTIRATCRSRRTPEEAFVHRARESRRRRRSTRRRDSEFRISCTMARATRRFRSPGTSVSRRCSASTASRPRSTLIRGDIWRRDRTRSCSSGFARGTRRTAYDEPGATRSSHATARSPAVP